MRALITRITNPAPPLQAELFDEDLARRFLERLNWDVDRAEAVWRRHRGQARRENEAAAAATANTPTSTDAAVDAPTQGASQPAQSAAPPSAQPLAQGGSVPAAPRVEDEELLGLVRSTNVPDSQGEQAHHDGATTFKKLIEEDHSVKISISEAVLLMQLAKWDIKKALADFTNRTDALGRLRTEFDGLRQLVQIDDSIQESKCLQLLTEITRRSDWLSLLVALREAKWNLVKVVIRWFKSGIPVYQKKHLPQGKKQDWGMRVDRWGRRLPQPAEDSIKAAANADFSGWAPDPNSFEDPSSQPSSVPRIWGQEWRDNEALKQNPPDPSTTKRKPRENRGREKGFMVDFIRDQLKAGKGNVSQSELYIEFFHKGRYWFKIFNNNQFIFADEPEDALDLVDDDVDDGDSSSPISQTSQQAASTPVDAPELFDETKQKHVDALNRWRGNSYWSIEQDNVRPQAQKWSQDELNFLYQLMVDLLAQHKQDFPRQSRRELVPLLQIDHATKLRWQRDFNNKFTGVVPPGEQYPRQDREHGAIIQMRKRFVRLATHFRIKLAPAVEDKFTDADKKNVEKWKKERDDMEDADEEVTRAYNEANPTDDPLEGRCNRKPKKQDDSDEQANDGDDGDGDGAGDGDGGDSGGDPNRGGRRRVRRREE